MDWMLLPFRRYAEFSGRSRRKEYWMFALFVVLAYLVFGVLMAVLGAGAMMGMGTASSGGTAAFGGGALIVGGLLALFGLAVLVPGIAVAIRRLHDTDRSGWWVLAPLAGYPIMLVGAAMDSSALALVGSLISLGAGLALLVFYLLDGTPGHNRFGPDPKGRGEPVGY